MLGPEDELRAAEADFKAEGNHDHVQLTSSDAVRDEAASELKSQIENSADANDQQPRKRVKLAEADKKRGVRMFGALMGTLSKFHDETSRTKQTEAAKRRAAVENRLQAKLKVESEALHKLRAFELEEKQLKHNMWRKADELGHLSALNPIRFANKLALSNHLRTSPSTIKRTDRTDSPLTPNPRSRDQCPQIYWLPHKLTSEQKEILESQRRAAREEVEEGERVWLEEKIRKQEELEQLQTAHDARLAEIEAEKARSRVLTAPEPSAQGTMPSEDAVAPEPKESQENIMRDTPPVQNDTPEAPSNLGRDEDAVEY